MPEYMEPKMINGVSSDISETDLQKDNGAEWRKPHIDAHFITFGKRPSRKYQSKGDDKAGNKACGKQSRNGYIADDAVNNEWIAGWDQDAHGSAGRRDGRRVLR